jgi:hypothetical protein
MRRPTYRQVVCVADALRQLHASGFVGDWAAVALALDTPFPAATVRRIGESLGLEFATRRAYDRTTHEAVERRVRQLEERADATAEVDGRVFRALQSRIERLELERGEFLSRSNGG